MRGAAYSAFPRSRSVTSYINRGDTSMNRGDNTDYRLGLYDSSHGPMPGTIAQAHHRHTDASKVPTRRRTAATPPNTTSTARRGVGQARYSLPRWAATRRCCAPRAQTRAARRRRRVCAWAYTRRGLRRLQCRMHGARMHGACTVHAWGTHGLWHGPTMRNTMRLPRTPMHPRMPMHPMHDHAHLCVCPCIYPAHPCAHVCTCLPVHVQSRSVNGHLVYSRAGFGAAQVTAVLRRAVAEHGRRGWWEVS